MKKYYISVFVNFVLIIQTSVVFAAQLSSSLEQYKVKTQILLVQEQNGNVKEYLQSCFNASNYLNGLEAGDARLPDAFTKVVKERKIATGNLTASSEPSVRAEESAYNEYLQPYRKKEYINFLALQEQLLERKYFKSETAKNANFLEGYVNSNWSLTRADHSSPSEVFNKPTLGISPWEAIFRLEPTMAFDDGVQAAVLGTAGLSYAIFPEIKRESEVLTFEESFWSQWIQKSGARIGVGVGNLDNQAKLLLGAGTQINAIGLWCLYKPDGNTFMFGLSASDLSKFKKVITWFE